MCKLLYLAPAPVTLGFLRGQAAYMSHRDLSICAISSPGPELEAFATSEHARVRSIAMSRSISPLRDIVSIIRLTRALRQERPQILHANTSKGGLLGTIAGRLAGVPIIVYHNRGLPDFAGSRARRSLLRLAERLSGALATQIFCVSHMAREEAVRSGLWQESKSVVFLGGSGNGVDSGGRFNPEFVSAEARAKLRASYAIPEDALVIGFVGRLANFKGLREIDEAWRLIRNSHPHARLMLVGSLDEVDPISPELLKAFEDDPRIILTGALPDVTKAYPCFDVVAFPTYREGLPNVPLETGAMMLPIVATRIPGCMEAVRDGETGILVPPRNASALAGAIVKYLDDATLRRTHGEAAREFIKENFRQEAIWQEVYRTYEKLLVRRGLPLPHSNLVYSQ